MASTYSDRLKLELMETGANAATWGTNTNNNLNVLDAYNNGYISKSVAGSTNVTLTASDASPSSEASNKVLELTGTLTGNIIVLIPARESNYIVYNNTSGAFTLSIGCDDGASGALGTTATVTQGIYNWIYSDGTNVTIAELNANASTISTGTLNNARLSALPNSVLENSAITINSTSVSLGGSINVGDIEGVTAGDGLTGGGTSGTVTLNVDLSELTTSTSNADGDFFVVVDSANAQKKLTKGNINLSGFNNDAGFSTGTVTSIGVTAGSGLTGGGTVTTSGTITVNVGAGTGIDVAADAISVDVSDFMTSGVDKSVVVATGADSMEASSRLKMGVSEIEANPQSTLQISNGATENTILPRLEFYQNDDGVVSQEIGEISWLSDEGGTPTQEGRIFMRLASNTSGGGDMLFYTRAQGGSQNLSLYLGNNGDLGMGARTVTTDSTTGAIFDESINQFKVTADGEAGYRVNRLSSDGTLFNFAQNGTTEGDITVSGSTVSYNGFTGTHWSRLSDNSKPTILKGTVLEALDEMMDWYQVEMEINSFDENKNPITMPHKESYALQEGQSVGDVITYNFEGTDYQATIIKEGDVKHTKCKVSDTANSKRVYGVFFSWDNDDDTVNDLLVAQVGTYVIRINSSATVQAGDFLVSNGDGTAIPLSEDTPWTVGLAKTIIGKVLSTTKIETYADGSYIVPCSLHC